jgi:hypothetical protein
MLILSYLFLNKTFLCVHKIAKGEYKVRHVRPSVRMEKLGTQWTDSHKIW